MAGSGLRGASADAMATLAGQVQDVSGEEAATLGEDLFGVAGVLRTQPSLRRVATDVSLEADAKADLVRSIFADRVGEKALDIVAEAVRQRWTASRDLADVLEQLGVEAVVRSAGDQADRLGDELFAVRQLIEEQPELRSALADPARSVQDKSELLRDLLSDKTLPATVRLVEQGIAGSHRTPSLALAEYEKVAAAVHGERVATVWVARELGEEERERLRTALSRQYDRDIHLNVVVEPALIGGMRVEIGDDVIDGAVSSRLDEARRKLAG